MERDLIINAFKENLVVAQNRMKKQPDLYKRELIFQVGEEIFSKKNEVRNFHLNSMEPTE